MFVSVGRREILPSNTPYNTDPCEVCHHGQYIMFMTISSTVTVYNAINNNYYIMHAWVRGVSIIMMACYDCIL